MVNLNYDIIIIFFLALFVILAHLQVPLHTHICFGTGFTPFLAQPITESAGTHSYSHTLLQTILAHPIHLHVFGENRSTRRKPTLTQGSHAERIPSLAVARTRDLIAVPPTEPCTVLHKSFMNYKSRIYDTKFYENFDLVCHNFDDF